MADDHDDGECLLGSPSPGDDRRAWLKRKAPVEGTRGRGVILQIGTIRLRRYDSRERRQQGSLYTPGPVCPCRGPHVYDCATLRARRRTAI